MKLTDKDLRTLISYINISRGNDSYFEWKQQSTQSYVLDINAIRKNETEEVFFHIEKNELKIVYIRKNKMVYTISTAHNLQYQILEALLDQICEKFNETFDLEIIFSFENVSPNSFKYFEKVLDDLLVNFFSFDLINKIDIFCKICNKLLPLYIKKKVIEESNNFPVPIIYRHAGHSLICFIDKSFTLRGVKDVVHTG